MTDQNLLLRIAEFMSLPRTMRAVCTEFQITRPTAVLWVGLLASDHGYTIHVADMREGKAGPRSKTYQARKAATP